MKFVKQVAGSCVVAVASVSPVATAASDCTADRDQKNRAAQSSCDPNPEHLGQSCELYREKCMNKVMQMMEIVLEFRHGHGTPF